MAEQDEKKPSGAKPAGEKPRGERQRGEKAKAEKAPRREKGAAAEAPAEAPRKKAPAEPAPIPRLLLRYREQAVPRLRERFAYRNPMQVPKLAKITLNVGLGEAIQNARLLEAAVEELGRVTGQKAVITRSKKAIANFRLREGMSIGCTVTLRRARMYEFLDRLVNVALPRVRDFRGVSPRSFDGRGNYTLGLREQILFPEIDYDKIEKTHGMNITFVTTARTDDEGRALLAELGMPFRAA
jgi:large subunit ribosomal protein L5